MSFWLFFSPQVKFVANLGPIEYSEGSKRSFSNLSGGNFFINSKEFIFFSEYFLRYIFVCVNTAIYMSFWGGEMKQFYYVCKVGVHCTYLFKVFFSMNGPQTAIDLNNGESFCIQKKMGTLKNRSFKTCHHWWGFQEMKSKTFFSWNQFYHEYFSWKMIGWTTFLNLSSTGICFCF